MAKFLDTILEESHNSIFNKYLKHSGGGTFLCRCYASGNEFSPPAFQPNSADRIFEIQSETQYRELQQIVDGKFGVGDTKIQYLDETEQTVLIDSDLVLQKAIKMAINNSYYEGEKEITLRLLVFPPNHF